MRFSTSIRNKLFNGNDRSKNITKNIICSILIKGFSIIISLTIIPVTFAVLDREKYGIWITLYSIVSWFNMLDIGLGNGFRNKFAIAVALKDNSKSKQLIETLYSATLLIAFSFFLAYSFIHPHLNWYRILNISNFFDENLSQIVYTVFGLFSLQLVLKNILTILLALQKTALNNLINLISSFLALILIIVWSRIGHVGLKEITLIYMLSTIFIDVFFTVFLFSNQLKIYSPRKLKIHRKCFSDIADLGIKFFVIQITTIIMFSSGNFLIAQLYGVSEVVPYNISYRLFSATMSLFTIILAPFWSAYTEAITKNDYSWIKESLGYLIKVYLLFVVGLLAFLLASPIIYDLWLGEKVAIPFSISASFALYVALLAWSGIFAQFLNGVGKVKIQLFIAIFQSLSNIPIAIFLAIFLKMGIVGIILATNINLAISAVILPMQVKRIINKNANGLWNE